MSRATRYELARLERPRSVPQAWLLDRSLRESVRTQGLEGTSLVVQWLRICLPGQEMQVRSLVEELRFHRLQDNSACMPQPLKPTHPRAHAPQQKFPWGTQNTGLRDSAHHASMTGHI